MFLVNAHMMRFARPANSSNPKTPWRSVARDMYRIMTVAETVNSGY